MRIIYGIATLLLTLSVEVLLFNAIWQGNSHAAWAAVAFTTLDLVVARRARDRQHRQGKNQSNFAAFGLALDLVLSITLLAGAFFASPILLGIVFWANLAILAVPTFALLLVPAALILRVARTA